MNNLDAVLDPTSEEIKALEKQKRDIDKEIKRVKSQAKMMDSLEKWKELSALQNELNQKVRKHSGWTLTKLQKMTPFYTLQHPTKSILKSDNEDDAWVQDFVKNGGKLTTLIDTADKSRIATWQRISKPKKRKKKKAKEGENEGDNQTNLEKNLEGVKSDIRKETS